MGRSFGLCASENRAGTRPQRLSGMRPRGPRRWLLDRLRKLRRDEGRKGRVDDGAPHRIPRIIARRLEDAKAASRLPPQTLPTLPGPPAGHLLRISTIGAHRAGQGKHVPSCRYTFGRGPDHHQSATPASNGKPKGSTSAHTYPSATFVSLGAMGQPKGANRGPRRRSQATKQELLRGRAAAWDQMWDRGSGLSTTH